MIEIMAGVFIWWLIGYGSLQVTNYIIKLGFFSATEKYDLNLLLIEIGIGLMGMIMVLPAVLIIMEEMNVRKRIKKRR